MADMANCCIFQIVGPMNTIFYSQNKKSKVKSADGKVVEVAVQRDILGFLITKSQEL